MRWTIKHDGRMMHFVQRISEATQFTMCTQTLSQVAPFIFFTSVPIFFFLSVSWSLLGFPYTFLQERLQRLSRVSIMATHKTGSTTRSRLKKPHSVPLHWIRPQPPRAHVDKPSGCPWHTVSYSHGGGARALCACWCPSFIFIQSWNDIFAANG